MISEQRIESLLGRRHNANKDLLPFARSLQCILLTKGGAHSSCCNAANRLSGSTLSGTVIATQWPRSSSAVALPMFWMRRRPSSWSPGRQSLAEAPKGRHRLHRRQGVAHEQWCGPLHPSPSACPAHLREHAHRYLIFAHRWTSRECTARRAPPPSRGPSGATGSSARQSAVQKQRILLSVPWQHAVRRCSQHSRQPQGTAGRGERVRGAAE